MADTARSAFVTGGSGFIGGRLIQRLTSEGWDVRALARSERSAEKVRALGAEPVTGDIASVDAVREGAHGCEYAFHAAAHVGDWGPKSDFVRDNVVGTRNALAGTVCCGPGITPIRVLRRRCISRPRSSVRCWSRVRRASARRSWRRPSRPAR